MGKAGVVAELQTKEAWERKKIRHRGSFPLCAVLQYVECP